MNDSILNSIESSPDKPGVYLWKDDKDRILYVGKAANLRERLKNYLKPADIKTQRLVENSQTLKTIITKTNIEALILEDALVKQNQPKYNVRLRDDKRYPYIRVTANEDYPRIDVVRRVEADDSRYFGPYTDSGSVRKVIKTVGELFGLRQCKTRIGKKTRPCINYSMGKCSAPCYVLDKREYSERVFQACRFLAGEYKKVRIELLDKIKKLSKRMEYEKASELRDTLLAIESLSQPQNISSAKLKDMDVLGYGQYEGNAGITQLKVRESRVVAVLNYSLRGEYSDSPKESMKAFIKQHYATKDLTPKLIYTSSEPEDKKVLEQALSKDSGFKVRISQATRGQERKLAEMAVEDSVHQLMQEKIEKDSVNRLDALRSLLRLNKIPRRIECYDISNIGEKHTVGGMVVFTGGKADEKEYRRFEIKATRKQDDPENMAEMIQRRFKHSEWNTPSLVVLDGGRTQLTACLKHIPDKVKTIALAKKFEEIYLPERAEPITVRKYHPALLLLQEIRDEAHRYSRAYHIKKREKTFL